MRLVSDKEATIHICTGGHKGGEEGQQPQLRQGGVGAMAECTRELLLEGETGLDLEAK